MAWNPSPEVAVARDAAHRLGANRVVIVYTTDRDQIGFASYGKTRALCDETGPLGRELYARAEKWFAESYRREVERQFK